MARYCGAPVLHVDAPACASGASAPPALRRTALLGSAGDFSFEPIALQSRHTMSQPPSPQPPPLPPPGPPGSPDEAPAPPPEPETYVPAYLPPGSPLPEYAPHGHLPPGSPAMPPG